MDGGKWYSVVFMLCMLTYPERQSQRLRLVHQADGLPCVGIAPSRALQHGSHGPRLLPQVVKGSELQRPRWVDMYSDIINHSVTSSMRKANWMAAPTGAHQGRGRAQRQGPFESDFGRVHALQGEESLWE